MNMDFFYRFPVFVTIGFVLLYTNLSHQISLRCEEFLREVAFLEERLRDFSKSFFLYLLHPSRRVSKSTVFTNHNLISVRHRKYRLIILLYLHVISCSSTWNLASSRDPEPRPSLESSNHSGLDLLSASIVESDLVFG